MKKIAKFIFNLLLSDMQKAGIASRIRHSLPPELNDSSLFFSIHNIMRLGYRPDIILDIGAFQGEWTDTVRKIFPESRILMVEPQASKKSILEAVAARSPKISYTSTLVGKENQEKVVFYEMETGSSIFQEQTDYPREITHYDMVTLDAIVAANNFNGDFFIKLDVQGAELDVLRGATETMNKAGFILLEASLLNYNEGAPLVNEVMNFLEARNFVLFDICEVRRQYESRIPFQADLLFCRKDHPIRRKYNYKQS